MYKDNELDHNEELYEIKEETYKNNETLYENSEELIQNNEGLLGNNAEPLESTEGILQNNDEILENIEVMDDNSKVELSESVAVNNYQQEIEKNSDYAFQNENRFESSNNSENKNNTPAVIFMIVTFILLIGLCIYIAVSISNGAFGSTKKDTVYQSESDDPWEEILGEDAEKKEADDESDKDSGVNSDDDFQINKPSIYDTIDWDKNNWKDKYVNHNASEIKGPYYNDFVDCIDESVDYKISREYEDYYDKEYNVCIRSSYVQIEGDIPNIDDINDFLKGYAVQPVQLYKDNEKKICEEIKSVNGGYIDQMDFNVTYNDENIISIIIQEESTLNNSSIFNIYSFNYDVATGTLLDNTKILDLGDGFGEEFRERSNKQNGFSEYGIEPYSNKDIVSMLNNQSNIILFYTPLGIELGYKYVEQYYSGWITITMQDYKDYLNTM